MNDNVFVDIDPDNNLINNLYETLDGVTQSGYFTIDQFNSNFNNKSGNLSLCNFNIRSFRANYDSFSYLLDSLTTNFSILTLTETRFSGNSGEVIERYCGFHCGRVNGGGGGVSVYCEPSLTCNMINHLTLVSDDLESCTVNIKSGGCSYTVVALYRPPNGSLYTFTDELLSILHDPILSKSEVIVTGDFNINLLNYENSCPGIRGFVNSMFSCSFLPVITKPTRFPSGEQLGQPSLLDHIWYNKYNADQSWNYTIWRD